MPAKNYVVKDKGGNVVNPKYYDITYTNNKAVGTATITATGKGQYKGTVSAQFTITANKLPSGTVTLMGDNVGKVYTGEEHWDDCIQQCDDIINSNRFALSDNYKDPFRSTGVETSKEVIFTIPFDANIAGGNSIHMFSWHGELKKKYETEATPWGCGSAMGVTQFIDTYDPKIPSGR